MDCVRLAGLPAAETANPQRMGAALTYARRYALFTLVGIAGEDDLDAPNLSAPSPSGSAPHRQSCVSHLPDKSRATDGPPTTQPNWAQSAKVRDRLLSEIEGLMSPDSAADWARGALTAKNMLVEVDATRVEEAFEWKVSTLIGVAAAQEGATGAPSNNALAPTPEPSALVPSAQMTEQRPAEESTLAIAKPRRHRNKDHLRYVARQACLICGRQPSDPHHLRYAQPRALGRKASDEFTVPLCRVHHREVHRVGNEQAWWQAAGIDPLSVAQTLWSKTRASEGHICADEGKRTPASAPADPSAERTKPAPKTRAPRASAR
jgi:hypothetical protein